MGNFINSFDHLINYTNKYAFIPELSQSDKSEVVGMLKEIFKNKWLTKRYTYVIRFNKSFYLNPESLYNLIEEFNKEDNRRFKNSLDIQYIKDGDSKIKNTDYITEFLIKEAKNKSGIYIFSSKPLVESNSEGNNIYYVGFSENLMERIPSSIKERFNSIGNDFSVSLIFEPNLSDASILELYFINKLNPTLNKSNSYKQKPTLFKYPTDRSDKYFRVMLDDQ